ncbi:MAG TPA: type VI secretion system protein [Blastocatellia bacterium]|nr:type VI secretion system protein [Blastocatellia bacterium]
MQTLTRLASSWEWILLGIALLIIVLLVLIFLLLRRANKRTTPKAAAADDQTVPAVPAKSPINPYLQLRVSFLRALRLLKSRVTGREYRYGLPWFLLLGEADSGKTTVAANTGLSLDLGEDVEDATDRHSGLNWWFFDNGVVLDVSGQVGGRTDGSAHRDGAWNALLKLLLKYRPQHAIDGIVLTIPCDDLIGPASLKADRMAAIKASAARFYQRLWRAQKVLGLSFPVYVLITKCDNIAGFSSFCRALPKNLQDDIFGWSNPYTLESAFNPSWLYEAFDELGQQLIQLQLEIFAEKETIEDRDDLFFFPTKLQELQSPLQTYLDILFKQSGFHQPFFLRGIYFCGDSAESSLQLLQGGAEPANLLAEDGLTEQERAFPYYVAPSEDIASAAVVRPAFLKGLFEQKIFQEQELSRPVFTTLLSRNRAVLTAQILILIIIVVGGLGLTLSYRHLEDRSVALKNLLDNIHSQLYSAREAHQGSLPQTSTSGLKPGETTSQPAERLSLTFGQPNLNADRKTEYDFIHQIRQTDGSSFYSFFMPTSWFSHINEEMENAFTPAFSSILLESSRIELDNRIDDLVNNQNIQINSYLVRLNDLVNYSRLYSRLNSIDSGSLKDLDDMIAGIKYEPILSNLNGSNTLYINALFKAHSKPLNHSAMNEGANRFETLLTRLYEDNVKETSHEVTTDFLEQVIRTDELLSSKDFNWLANYHFVAHPDFGNKTYEAAVHDLRVAFSDLARERFMQPNTLDANFKARLLSRGQLSWNKESLEKAIGLYNAYENYLNNVKDSYDPVQRKANDVALNQLQNNIKALIWQAQQFGHNPGLVVGNALQKEALSNELLTEVRNLKDVEEPLGNLIDICNQIGIGKAINDPVADQASYLLQASFQLMLLDNPYAVKRGNFSWWDGSRPVSLLAFNASSSEDLAKYLAVTRENIAQLAMNYVAPVITFTTAKHIDRLDRVDYRKKWLDIIEDLDAYKNKAPENAVGSLETFILVDMDKTSMGDCLRGSSQIDPGELSDSFFRKTRLTLRAHFYQQCGQLAQADLIKQYNGVAEFFNKHLAGKFPFAASEGNQPLGEADPQVILDFFQLYDTLSPQTRQALADSSRFGITRTRALAFIDQVEKAKAFLVPFIGKEGIPLSDIDVKFRVNEREELWASQIIEWEMDIGKESLNNRDAGHMIRWRFGDPIRLSLRWAKDSPTIPDPDSRTPEVQGRLAYFDYTNYWSLLSLLIDHETAAADFYDPIEKDPATFKFLIPIRSAIPGALSTQPPGRDNARIFIRLNVMPTDKKEPLTVPVFPKRAPLLVQTLVTEKTGTD